MNLNLKKLINILLYQLLFYLKIKYIYYLLMGNHFNNKTRIKIAEDYL